MSRTPFRRVTFRLKLFIMQIRISLQKQLVFILTNHWKMFIFFLTIKLLLFSGDTSHTGDINNLWIFVYSTFAVIYELCLATDLKISNIQKNPGESIFDTLPILEKRRRCFWSTTTFN